MQIEIKYLTTRKKTVYENREQRKEQYQEDKEKKYRTDHWASEKKRKFDSKIQLIQNSRSRKRNAFKLQSVKRNNKTFDSIGGSHRFFFKNWLHFQLYREMAVESYGSVWSVDRCFSISSFILLDENELRKRFGWISLRPMYSDEKNLERAKIDYRLKLMQEVKAKKFRNLSEQEG